MTVLQMRDTDEGNQLPPKKRRLSSRHHNEDTRQSIEAWLIGQPSSSIQMPAAPDTMVNSFGLNDPFHQTHLPRSPEENGYCEGVSPIAPILNLGNTCFLNSVLYTLRFAPSFLHKLHHLNNDFETFIRQMQANKDRIYSLGRHVGRGMSCAKDCSSYVPNGSEIKTQAVINKLHQVYTSLCINELKDRTEPFQPNFFLHALRDVNPMFEGNQQHDAHELLVCLLDIFREACELLYQQNNCVERISPPSSAPSTSSSFKSVVPSVVRKSLKKIMRPDKRVNFLRENHSEGDIKKYMINGSSDIRDDAAVLFSEERRSSNQNTLFDDFVGVSLLRTTCLECEQVTERKETFCDICVPVETIADYNNVNAVDDLYKRHIVTEEYLIDCNKYWCERCSRLNEAKRCVKYEKLPRLLTLHLKRFSSGFGNSVSKISDHMPTPLQLPCFCQQCLLTAPMEERPHCYSLYAIIMHIGVSIASGHYVAYVKVCDNAQDYLFCSKDKPKTSSLSRGSSINSVTSNNGNNMLDKTAGISKYFMKLSSKSFSSSSSGPANTKESDLRNRMNSTCRGIDCCSVRSRIDPEVDLNSMWLECDDETVRPISSAELLEVLSPTPSKNGSITPYLLFYTKADSY